MTHDEAREMACQAMDMTPDCESCTEVLDVVAGLMVAAHEQGRQDVKDNSTFYHEWGGC